MLLGSRIAVAVALSGGCSCDWALAGEPPCAASVALKDKKTKKKKKKRQKQRKGKGTVLMGNQASLLTSQVHRGGENREGSLQRKVEAETKADGNVRASCR